MKRVMVRYKVKPDQVEANEELVRGVYEELAVARPEGLRYATFKLDDGVSFVHLAEHGDPNPLRDIAAFRHFQEGIADRCDEQPVAAEVELVGAYGFFGEDAQ